MTGWWRLNNAFFMNTFRIGGVTYDTQEDLTPPQPAPEQSSYQIGGVTYTVRE